MNPNSTCTMQSLVYVVLKGEPRPKPDGCVQCYDDGGLIQEFFTFCIANKVYDAVSFGMSGMGICRAFFTPEDARKIKEWLESKGITVKEIA
jgi:hypothetical protein